MKELEIYNEKVLSTDKIITELKEVNKDLLNELAEIKNELIKSKAQKVSKIENSLFSPDLYKHYHDIVAVNMAKSDFVPKEYKNKPEDIFIAMSMGFQLGLPLEQSLCDIAVINGRPCLWGDGLLALCQNHKDYVKFKEEEILDDKGIIIGYSFTIWRKNHDPHTSNFTLEDAQKAGLLKKPGAWANYPKRMLKLRARSFALRDMFSDALRGANTVEIEKENSQLYEGEFKNTEYQDPKTYSSRSQLLTKIMEEEENKEYKEEINIDDDPIDWDDSDNEQKITPVTLKKINDLIEEKRLPIERQLRAKDQFNVSKFEDLIEKQGKKLVEQLQMIK